MANSASVIVDCGSYNSTSNGLSIVLMSSDVPVTLEFKSSSKTRILQGVEITYSVPNALLH
jgi:hypothetical protein